MGQWIKSKRRGIIQADDIEVFVPQWHEWWKAVNPKWRERKGDRFVQGGEGDWQTMFITGINGFLTVVALVGTLITQSDTETVRYAVYDVKWVVTRVLDAKLRFDAG